MLLLSFAVPASRAGNTGLNFVGIGMLRFQLRMAGHPTCREFFSGPDFTDEMSLHFKVDNLYEVAYESSYASPAEIVRSATSDNSGKLGSGKTSFIMQLARIAMEEGLKIAVWINEIKEVGSDDQYMPQNFTHQEEIKC
jgi:hypothetical protein